MQAEERHNTTLAQTGVEVGLLWTSVIIGFGRLVFSKEQGVGKFRRLYVVNGFGKVEKPISIQRLDINTVCEEKLMPLDESILCIYTDCMCNRQTNDFRFGVVKVCMHARNSINSISNQYSICEVQFKWLIDLYSARNVKICNGRVAYICV